MGTPSTPQTPPPIDAAQFVIDFAEFADVDSYPLPVIQFWLNWAYLFLNNQRWGQAINLGAELFAAHNIVLERQALDAAGVSGWPGLSKGPVSSETPGSVSVSYDTNVASEEGAGNWNLTVYGTRYIRLAKMMGSAPTYIGVGCDPTGGLNGPGWPGPPIGIGWGPNQ